MTSDSDCFMHMAVIIDMSTLQTTAAISRRTGLFMFAYGMHDPDTNRGSVDNRSRASRFSSGTRSFFGPEQVSYRLVLCASSAACRGKDTWSLPMLSGSIEICTFGERSPDSMTANVQVSCARLARTFERYNE